MSIETETRLIHALQTLGAANTSIVASDMDLMVLASLSHWYTLRRARNGLIMKGQIGYRRGQGRTPSRYKLTFRAVE